MAKQAKKKQTEWNKQGKEIADMSVPMYESNLDRIDDYLSNPTERQDMYLNKYYGTNNATNSDFLRQYQRTMGNTTANNYNATSGGYSSANQRNYEDQQRYQNDLASRLADQGAQSAYNMAQNDYANMLNANNAYHNAYALGKNYSDVDQYNDAVRQGNKNWLGSLLQSAGQAGMSSGNPWGMAIGAAVGTAGGMMQTDTSGITEGGQSGTAGTSAYTNAQNDFATGMGLGLRDIYEQRHPEKLAQRLARQKATQGDK